MLKFFSFAEVIFIQSVCNSDDFEYLFLVTFQQFDLEEYTNGFA